MRAAQRFALGFAFAILTAANVSASSEEEPGATADEALEQLKDGNRRFTEMKANNPNRDLERRFDTANEGQKPLVTILGCSDSRVPAEIVFDAGIGDLFVVRVAGNVSDTDEIGSVEYGVGHLMTPLLVVLGHEKCGAVKAVAENTLVHGSIPQLVDNIKPAVESARKVHPTLKGDAFIPFAVRANVLQSIEDLLTRSETARDRVKGGELKIVGAVYDIETGKVSWIGEHPNLGRLLKRGQPAHAAKESGDAVGQHAPAGH